MKTFFERDHIHTVMLDMDGTVLDLHFDDYFWRQVVPKTYADTHQLPISEVLERLRPEFENRRGTLEWYCLDFWSDLLGFNVQSLKQNYRDRIRFLPGAVSFLESVKSSGKRLLLVTNSHRDAMSLKFECTGLDGYFDAIYTSHDSGFPKERQEFWTYLMEHESFDPSRTFFADDNLDVLRSANRYGIADLMGISKPDTQSPVRMVTEFESVESLGDLV